MLDPTDPKVVEQLSHCSFCGRDLLEFTKEECTVDPETKEFVFPIAIVPVDENTIEVYCDTCYSKTQC